MNEKARVKILLFLMTFWSVNITKEFILEQELSTFAQKYSQVYFEM